MLNWKRDVMINEGRTQEFKRVCLAYDTYGPQLDIYEEMYYDYVNKYALYDDCSQQETTKHRTLQNCTKYSEYPPNHPCFLTTHVAFNPSS